MSDIDQIAARVNRFMQADQSDRAQPRAVIAETRVLTGQSHDTTLLTSDLAALVKAATEHTTVRCPICLGSGMVAIGHYGSRPQRATCKACNGAKVVDIETMVVNLLAAETALLKVRAALNVSRVDDEARIVGIRNAMQAWELSQ